jgi:nickel/cobalt transporter (NiCoT) family protein
MTGLAGEALILVFILGLRHGLDPDHIAVIDSLTLRANEMRPGWAPWIGSLFALGHSLSVAAVAVLVALFSADLSLPAWAGVIAEWLVIALLLLVGSANLRALLTRGSYKPVGWRTGLLPAALRQSSHPVGAVLIGLIFGLVFDTVTQAAAWGTVASAHGGIAGALALAGAFAAGMIIVDTADSQIMARLLRRSAGTAQAQRYRRGAGWLVVGLSYGTAAIALSDMSGKTLPVSETVLTLIGAGAALLILLFLLAQPGTTARQA